MAAFWGLAWYFERVKPITRKGNWTPDGRADRASLRRDFAELTPIQRVEQVFELSKFMAEVADTGRRRRLA
jgi:hypothetical protein